MEGRVYVCTEIKDILSDLAARDESNNQVLKICPTDKWRSSIS